MRPKKILLGALLVIVAAALWYLGRTEVATQSKQAGTSAPEGPAIVGDAPPPVRSPEVSVKKDSNEKPESHDIPGWVMKIDNVLRSSADTAAMAQMLLQQVPTMPGEGQLESARHIVNLMPDKDYLSVMPYVRNTKLDPGFQEVIVSDSLNRPDVVKLPLLLAAAQTPKHPMGEIAKSTLAFLLDANFENDWGRWESAVRETLAKQQQGAQQ